MNKLTCSEAYNRALLHWGQKQRGVKPSCPYEAGTSAHETYHKQMKRLEGLSHGSC